MARVDLYVPDDQMDEARLVLLASEIDDAMDLPEGEADDHDDRPVPSWVWVMALIVLVIAVAAPVLRWLAD